jgi:hypothetical protein
MCCSRPDNSQWTSFSCIWATGPVQKTLRRGGNMFTSFANWPMSRRNLLRGCAFTGLATALSPVHGLSQDGASENPTGCAVAPPPETPAQALEALTKGNERWATCTQCHPREDLARRMSVVNGQSPFAAILSCSDSRVPPEFILIRDRPAWPSFRGQPPVVMNAFHPICPGGPPWGGGAVDFREMR